VKIHDDTVVRFECGWYSDDLRSARILRKTPFKSQANNQRYLDSGPWEKPRREHRNRSVLLEVTPETDRSSLGVAEAEERKQFHKVARPGQTAAEEKLATRRRSWDDLGRHPPNKIPSLEEWRAATAVA